MVPRQDREQRFCAGYAESVSDRNARTVYSSGAGRICAGGKATFGFVAKYKKNVSTPTGNTEFQYQSGGLNFSSTGYLWLVVSGAKAQYTGDGTINGSGSYGLLVTAIDGKRPGGGGVDRFRIKIWNRTTHVVIYDNQPGADEDSSAATALGGGSVTVHP